MILTIFEVLIMSIEHIFNEHCSSLFYIIIFTGENFNVTHSLTEADHVHWLIRTVIYMNNII